MADEIPPADPRRFLEYYRRKGPMNATDGHPLVGRTAALLDVRDPRLFRVGDGDYTDGVVLAAAVAPCTSKGFDVDDLFKRASEPPRPAAEVRLPTEPWYKEPMMHCRKCGLWWWQSEPEKHRDGC